MISAIVCVDRKGGIGKKNGLLFNIPKDMQMFKSLTTGQIVGCGERTLLSFPKSKPLKNRSTIVLCQEDHHYDDCICAHTFEEFLNIVKVLAMTKEVFIIGGGMMYSSMLDYYDRIYLTKVDAEDPEATVFFPDVEKTGDFKVVKCDADHDENYDFKFMTYERVRK